MMKLSGILNYERKISLKVKVYTLNAFGKTDLGGNPAGVVIDRKDLNSDQMKEIAAKVGFSETAFVSPSDLADFKLRFFTPSEEVDLCGHATIATFYLLHHLKIVKTGSYSQETLAGVLDIHIKEDGTVYMSQTCPQFYGCLDKDEIASSLNISVDKISNSLPIEIVSTGLKDIIVPVNTLADLLSIKANFDEISKISERCGATGYHVFTLETKYKGIAHSRNFAPLYAIPEESATGTATGALSSYLFKHSKLSTSNVNDLTFEQGYSMDMPSEIKARLDIANAEIINVTIGGKASNLKEIIIEI